MNRWLQAVLAPLGPSGPGLSVVLDRDDVVDPADLPGTVAVCHDWWSLRCGYERAGRRQAPGGGAVVLLVVGDFAPGPLPWDIERAASTVTTVRLPGPPELRAALRKLHGDEADRVIQTAATSSEPTAAALSALTGVNLPPGRPDRMVQFRLAARLAVRPDWPGGFRDLARAWVDDPILAGLLAERPHASRLQREWDDFASGRPTSWVTIFDADRVELGELFAADLLQAVPSSTALPSWAAVGIREPSMEEHAERLLGERPEPFPPTDPPGWGRLAIWWGELRQAVATAPPALRDRAWASWSQVDDQFGPWLRDNFGLLLTSAAPWPSALHKVAPFLARRIGSAGAERILLVVLDGLGYTQWAHLRRRIEAREVESSPLFAMLPTYTTVSRQAIFAGALPVTYPATLWTTSAEERHWKEFWVSDGLPVTGVTYRRVKGRLPEDHVELGAAHVVGVVVNAVDDLMHTSELFGDAQLLANLDVWAANGFLDDLVARAHAAGFETWITADHGNIECVGSGNISEGAIPESAGKRLIRYPNRTLRDASTAEGIVWDRIPGLPPDADPLLIATGRTAFTNHRLSVSHGGLSIDEVIVPLARVAP